MEVPMDMVERTAKAICETLFGFYDENDDSPSSPLGQSRLAARAAIAAMREPTEEMLAQVVTEPTHLYGQDGRGPKYEKSMKLAVQVDRMVVRQRWKDMIDAALSLHTSQQAPSSE